MLELTLDVFRDHPNLCRLIPSLNPSKWGSRLRHNKRCISCSLEAKGDLNISLQRRHVVAAEREVNHRRNTYDVIDAASSDVMIYEQHHP